MQLGIRVACAMRAAGHGHSAQRLLRGAVFMHVAALDHGVAGGGGQPAVGSVVAAWAGIHGAVSRSRVVGIADKRHVTLSRLNRRHRHGHQRDVGRAALVPGTADARHHTKRLGHLLAVHELVRRGGHLDEHAIDH